MRFMRCECENCGLEYLVKFENGIPKYKLSCIQCKSPYVRITWIDRASINGDMVIDPNL